MASEIQYEKVQFTYPGQEPVWMPVSEAFDWYDGQDLLWHVSYVTYRVNGREIKCFAKDWQIWDEAMQTWRLTRIGSGAYGDGLVVSREEGY